MNEMKIDLHVIRDWVGKWQANNGVNKTASQLAAVMLSHVLEENEKRMARTQAAMKALLEESRSLGKIEHEIVVRLRSNRGMDAQVEEQLKGHRRRMAVLMKEADEAMRVPSSSESVRVGGLLFEINKNASSARVEASDGLGA
jgi:hypothetical protein